MTRHLWVLGLMLAALLAGPACKKKADVTIGTAASALQGAPTTHPEPHRTLDALPPGILAVAGVQSLDALRAASGVIGDGPAAELTLDALLRAADLPPDVAAAVDPTKPAYFVLGVSAAEGTSMLVPLRDPLAWKAPPPESGGHYEVVGRYLLRADSASVAAAHRATLEKARTTFPPATAVHVLASGPALVDGLRPVATEAKRELEQTFGLAAAMSPLPGGDGNAAKIYGKWIDRAMGLLAEVEWLDFRVAVDAERVRAELLVTVREDGTLRKVLAHAEKTGSAAVGLLPPDAWAVLSANVDASLLGGLQADAAEMLTEMAKSANVSAAEVNDLYASALAVQTGDWAMGLYARGGFPFAMIGASLTTDGDRLRDTLEGFGALYLRLMDSMRSAPGGSSVAIDCSSFERLFESLTALTSAFGFRIEADEAGDVVAARAIVDWTRLAAMGGTDMKPVESVFGTRWEMAFGFGPVVVSSAFGPTGMDDAKGVLEGRWTYADEGFRTSVARGAARPFLVAWLDVGRFSAALAGLVAWLQDDDPGVAERARTLRAAPPGPGLAVTVGGTGKTLHAVIDLPVAGLKALRAIAP